jgi:hypothetical protein
MELRRWRCRECDRLLGGALVSIKWHDAPRRGPFVFS